jgi:hypothetical protein
MTNLIDLLDAAIYLLPIAAAFWFVTAMTVRSFRRAA